MHRRGLTTITALAAISLLAACSASDAGSGSGDDSYTSTAKANLENYYAGTDRSLPAEAPAPPSGKKVWVMACSTAAEGCATPANAAAEAGRELGWEVTVQDGKLDPNVYNQVIRSAIAAKVDGIILAGADCGPAAEAIRQATGAGIKVVGTVALDCNQEYVGGEALFSAQVSYCPEPTEDPVQLQQCFEDFLNGEMSGAMADYAIAKLDGKAEVIVMQEDDALEARIIGEAFQEHMKQCGGCQVHVVPFTGQDLIGGTLQTKAAAALSRYPTANAVMIPYDAAGLLGVTAAVKTAQNQGRELEMIGQEGLAGAIEQIKSGNGQTFAAGAPSAWWGWAAIDTMNRSFAGEPQVDQGIGVGAVDSEHNLPTDTPYYNGNPDTAWEENYRKIWGLS